MEPGRRRRISRENNGILRCSHQAGSAQEFMSPVEWAHKQSELRTSQQMELCCQGCTGLECDAGIPDGGRSLRTSSGGQRCLATYRLSRRPVEGTRSSESAHTRLARREIYGEAPIIGSRRGPAKEILAPSRPGPVAQEPYTVKEAEGPKHLYVLQLEGDTDAFLGEPADGRIIVKAGFSGSPETRCDDHNRTLPQLCAFRWKVLHSGPLSGLTLIRHPNMQKQANAPCKRRSAMSLTADRSEVSFFSRCRN